MSTDNLNTLFRELKDGFDIEEPQSDHKQRFLEKLNTNKKMASGGGSTSSDGWKPFLMIAASLVLILTLVIGSGNPNSSRDLANISPEMATTQDFFTTAIATELEKLNNEESPEYQNLVVDALFQIKILEEDYQNLKTDLEDSGDDQRVIHAMITNFQNRIDILKNVSEQIDELKQFKQTTDENSYTL